MTLCLLAALAISNLILWAKALQTENQVRVTGGEFEGITVEYRRAGQLKWRGAGYHSYRPDAEKMAKAIAQNFDEEIAAVEEKHRKELKDHARRISTRYYRVKS